MKPDARPIGLRGFLIDAPRYGSLRGIRDGALLIEEGCISACDTFEAVQANHDGRDIRWMHSPETVVIPGLIDLHTHLPQYPAVARQTSGQPFFGETLDHQFREPVARVHCRPFFEELLRNGSTCSVVHAATHASSTETAFAAAEQSGLRVTIGKLMRDIRVPGAPPAEKSTAKSLAQSEALCRKWHGRDDGRLEYVYSPTSLASCSEELLRGVVERAAAGDIAIQTHLSASPDEAASLSELFSQPSGATEALAAYGLLSPRSLLSPCLHLNEQEIACIAGAGSAVVHCPTSDFEQAHGLFPLDRLRQAGLRIGLGSDVAGGSELNLWQVMRSCLSTQTARHYADASVPIPGPAEVFHLATQGGADALGKGSLIGSLDIGREADLLVLDLATILPYGRKPNPHANLDAADVIKLLVQRGTPSALIEVFVRGRSLHRAATPMLV